MSARSNAAITKISSDNHGNPIRSIAASLRAGLLKSLENSMPTQQLGLLVGILLGIRVDIDPSLLMAFSATGTYHLLATAGLHLAIVYKLLRWLYESIRLPSKMSAVLCIVSLWIYDYMAGNRMAVTRAAIMATIYLAGIIIERPANILNSLGAAACIVLFLYPMQSLDAGFIISFAAVLMIGCCMPIWSILWKKMEEGIKHRRGKKLARNFSDLVGATLFAQAGAAPVCAYFFNIVSFLGIFANIFVVPSLLLIIPIGFFVAFSGLLFPALARVMAHLILTPLVWFDEKTVTLFSKILGSWVNAPSPRPLVLVAYYITVTLIMLAAGRYAMVKIQSGELSEAGEE
jgi:competence protein ComEC